MNAIKQAFLLKLLQSNRKDLFNSLDFLLTYNWEVSIYWQDTFVLKHSLTASLRFFLIKFVRWLAGKRVIKLSLVGNSNWKYFLQISCHVRLRNQPWIFVDFKAQYEFDKLNIPFVCFIVLNWRSFYNCSAS